ncbi:5'-nucleotidase domain-containing protein 1-like [Mizuhopecten yessoensis]|uniref:5'-nucleotidase domain-containing protein 1 n=1 Tax=Mizuhopecten yessoensis TaxID=6573 RepID=A0A210QIB4_MIZYE|nr:5'-nucleotidase domain-containing protein 1-like [Mizuhopecten yessoensis]OWF48503.1 5'-nucleotidase domain-containing protein 1 [Mizuhopecten yessoensis]
MAETFCLSDFDAYGFDMDHTLAKYKLVNLMQLSYEAICDCLIQKSGYSPKLKDDIHLHKDFICKGLFFDAARGNILKLSHDGKILRASHGTRMMSEDEMISVYGTDLHWEHFHEAQRDVKCTGAGFKFRFFENYFDIPGAVICAHIVDTLDEEEGKPLEQYTFWEDVLVAMHTNFIPSAFTGNAGWFFPKLKANAKNYLQECSQGVKQWLKDLRQKNKIVFLMTSSGYDFASLVMNVILGADWQSFFDICLFNARKPAFFMNKTSFLKIEGGVEDMPVKTLRKNGCYSQGNLEDLTAFLSSQTDTQQPKVVYFGDSLCSDSYPARTYAGWSVVLVLEEMEAEGYHLTRHDLDCDDEQPASKVRQRQVNIEIDPEEESFLLSKMWGSFFYHEKEDTKHDGCMNTFWGRLVSQYNAIAIPIIEYIAGMPISHVYTRFGREVGSTSGFHPAKPKPLMPSKTLEISS